MKEKGNKSISFRKDNSIMGVGHIAEIAKGPQVP
jgi:hypothetical protein